MTERRTAITRQLNTGGYAWMDNAIIDDNRLDTKDLLVYLILCRFADVETNSTFVSQGKIADKLGMGRGTVNLSIKKLSELGYIEKKMRARKNGGRASSEYHIVDVNYLQNSTVEIDELNSSFDEISKNLDAENEAKVFTQDSVSDSQSLHTRQGVEAKVFTQDRGEGAKVFTEDSNVIKALSFNKDLKDLTKNNKGTQNSLFDIPNENTKEINLPSRKGKSRSLAKIKLYDKGELVADDLDTLDLCYLFTVRHKEITGKVISVVTAGKKSESDLSTFLDAYSLDAKKFIDLAPKIITEFKKLDELKEKRIRANKLHIGNLAQTWFMDSIMNLVTANVDNSFSDLRNDCEDDEDELLDMQF